MNLYKYYSDPLKLDQRGLKSAYGSEVLDIIEEDLSMAAIDYEHAPGAMIVKTSEDRLEIYSNKYQYRIEVSIVVDSNGLPKVSLSGTKHRARLYAIEMSGESKLAYDLCDEILDMLDDYLSLYNIERERDY